MSFTGQDNELELALQYARNIGYTADWETVRKTDTAIICTTELEKDTHSDSPHGFVNLTIRIPFDTNYPVGVDFRRYDETRVSIHNGQSTLEVPRVTIQAQANCHYSNLPQTIAEYAAYSAWDIAENEETDVPDAREGWEVALEQMDERNEPSLALIEGPMPPAFRHHYDQAIETLKRYHAMETRHNGSDFLTVR